MELYNQAELVTFIVLQSLSTVKVKRICHIKFLLLAILVCCAFYRAEAQWSTATLSVARRELSATSVGTKVFFAGGSDGIGYLNIVDIYDNSTNTWSNARLNCWIKGNFSCLYSYSRCCLVFRPDHLPWQVLSPDTFSSFLPWQVITPDMASKHYYNTAFKNGRSVDLTALKKEI